MLSIFSMVLGLIALLFIPSSSSSVQYALTAQRGGGGGRGGGGDMRWGIVVEWIHRCKIELKPNEEWKTRTGLSNPPGLPRLPCPPPQACVLKSSTQPAIFIGLNCFNP